MVTVVQFPPWLSLELGQSNACLYHLRGNINSAPQESDMTTNPVITCLLLPLTLPKVHIWKKRHIWASPCDTWERIMGFSWVLSPWTDISLFLFVCIRYRLKGTVLIQSVCSTHTWLDIWNFIVCLCTPTDVLSYCISNPKLCNKKS